MQGNMCVKDIEIRDYLLSLGLLEEINNIYFEKELRLACTRLITNMIYYSLKNNIDYEV